VAVAESLKGVAGTMVIGKIPVRSVPGGRPVDSDDIAWASYHYPEGTAATDPAALERGDVRFASRYGLITGTLHHGARDAPVPGGAPSIARLESSR
jgi:hypothetical protein